MSVCLKGCEIPKRDTADGSLEEGFVALGSLKEPDSKMLYERVRSELRESYRRGSKDVTVAAFIVNSNKIGGLPRYYVKLKDCLKFAAEDYLSPAERKRKKSNSIRDCHSRSTVPAAPVKLCPRPNDGVRPYCSFMCFTWALD